MSINIGRTRSLFPVALKHLSGELRDLLYLNSAGRVDFTRPRRFYGILNERCNSKCLGCRYWRLPNYKEELNAEQWIKILDSIKAFTGVYHISFSGGEPLLKKGLFRILRHCRNNGILASLTTNAMMLNGSQAAQIVECQPFSLNISIDGCTEAVHDMQRGGKGSFQRAMDAIQLIRLHSKRLGYDVPIIIKTTVSKLNYTEMPGVVRLSEKIGAKGVLFQPVSDWGTKEIDDLWINELDKLQKIIETLLKMQHEGYPILNSQWHLQDWFRHFAKLPREYPSSKFTCAVGLDTLVILCDGTVHNCHKLDPIGNIVTNKVRDIWYGEKAKRRRSESLVCRLDCSENCSVRRSVQQRFNGAKRLIRK
jgi:MoaA/NifB/PqqE/SkfB family radical SAM enzyme